MKKGLLILGAIIVISTSTYAFRGNSYGGGCFGGSFSGMGRGGGYHMGYRGNGYPMGYRGNEYNTLTTEQQQEYLQVREQNIGVYNKYSIDIQQKRLDVERELLNEKPDWKKIGKLNEEIAKLEAQMKTEQMKNSY